MKAANQGQGNAQFNLGICYKNGFGVKIDYDQAAMWFRKAA
jgi:TPR repeat protein